MPGLELALLAVAVLLVAFLYSSVGHAGASGYIAVMTLFSLAPAVIKPTALILNILVSCIATWHFWRSGHFSWQLFWPFALLSIPFAFLGGYLNLPSHVFKVLVGLILLFSAVRFLFVTRPDEAQNQPSRPAALSIGAALGLLSGLTGTGGGIFLTPILLFMRWARTKPAASASALFILVNSAAGLLGNVSSARQLPTFAIPLWSPTNQSGADVMKRIAAPMIGGVITSGILELLLYPVIYVLWRKRHLPFAGGTSNATIQISPQVI